MTRPVATYLDGLADGTRRAAAICEELAELSDQEARNVHPNCDSTCADLAWLKSQAKGFREAAVRILADKPQHDPNNPPGPPNPPRPPGPNPVA